VAEHQTYTARWIFPIDAPPIERGTITIANDKIVAVEPHSTHTPDVDLGNVAILPGFVNAHTHLDLTGARGICPPTSDFTHWLRRVIMYRVTRSLKETQADIYEGLAQCLGFGTTLVGDIAFSGLSWIPLSNAHCRSVVFYEAIGLTRSRTKESWDSARHWVHHQPTNSDCKAAFSPHAPYSVSHSLFRFISHQNALVATHLAETKGELELLRSQSGPFVEFLKELNVWEADGFIGDVQDIVALYPRGIFIHCNYLDPATSFLPTQTVVVCPRTHAAFGHPHHPFPQMNVRVALGTDSLASNPDLDILAEARFLRQHYPEVAPDQILRMLTLNGAEALDFASVAGSLTPGKSADLVVLPLLNEHRNDPHELVLDSILPVQKVMFRGEWNC
jgi:aminodeoxyfutalosine deaminase